MIFFKYASRISQRESFEITTRKDLLMRGLNRCWIVLMCSAFLLGHGPLQAAETLAPVVSGQVPSRASSVMAPSTLQKLSFDYTDANLPTVLKSIAYSCNLNLVIPTDIKGKVTAQLKDISIDGALNAILSVNGYGFSRKENIVYIVPEAKIDLVTEVIPLGYLLAKDAKLLLAKFISKRGDIQIQVVTNSLIVTDVPENIQDVKKKISGIDQPPMQVLIEAKIVDISVADAQNIGTTFNATFTPSGGSLSTIGLNAGNLGNGGIVNMSSMAESLNPGGSFQLVPRSQHLAGSNLTIDALVQKNRARLLAAPSIATLSGLEAKIMIGDHIPYKSSTASITAGTGSTTTTSTETFVDVGTSLKVTPQVSPDGWITMKIHPEVSTVVGQVPSDGTAPRIGTRDAEATIRIKDNETIIIGGLINEQKNNSEDGTPGLRSIPILGWFFKRHMNSEVKTELMVFITPHIIRSPGQKTGLSNSALSQSEPTKLDLPREVRIDSSTLSKDTEMLTALLSYVNELENSVGTKSTDNLFLKLELLKTYKTIVNDFPESGKSDYCLFKIASLYIKDFGKCGAAQEALTQLEDRFPQSPYLDATQSLVQACPKEAFIIREGARAKTRKK